MSILQVALYRRASPIHVQRATTSDSESPLHGVKLIVNDYDIAEILPMSSSLIYLNFTLPFPLASCKFDGITYVSLSVVGGLSAYKAFTPFAFPFHSFPHVQASHSLNHASASQLRNPIT